MVCQKKIKPGTTLLFLDEIQSTPRALMALRYFYESLPELHVIAAGSLLEFSLKDISFPVGRVQFMELFHMNFAEFLLAEGKEQFAALILPPLPIDFQKVTSETIHHLLLDEVRKHCLESVLRNTAKSAGQQIKYSRLAEGYSHPTLKRAFDVLCHARLVQKIESTSPAGLPLGFQANAGRFKALLIDIGLMHHLCTLSLEKIATEKNLLSIYEGAF